tara:strand:+ start:202 stop:348 length:147 start_codon:yes stop_codon:yes gene_type:complete
MGREPNKEDRPYIPWGPGHPDHPDYKGRPKLAKKVNKFSGKVKEINNA